MKLIPKPKGHPIKLVRDKTPDLINFSGLPGSLFYGQIKKSSRLKWLKRKLGEEVTEFLVDGTAGELLDVYAVVEGLAHEMGLKRELKRSILRDERGGFYNGVMMYGYHPEFDSAPKKPSCDASDPAEPAA